MDAAGNELKAVRLELPVEAHRELRIEAAKEGVSMAAFVRHLVEDFLEKIRPQKPKGKGKEKT